MKIKKPKFWDFKKPNLISYLLLPLTLPVIINNFFLRFKKNKKNDEIKSICVGNIYIGGTGKTPLTIKINNILKKTNLKTATVKKFYKDQIDEQELLKKESKLYCYKNRQEGIDKAIKDKIDVVIFDDGLQDASLNYNLAFVCFNSSTWVGNGFLIPAGPLREKLNSLSKYDAVFLNGNGENVLKLKSLIRKFNKKIKIFETFYRPKKIKRFNKKEKYLIFSGIGNPESFKKTLINNDFKIVKEIIFPDHYQYSLDDINSIKAIAKKLKVKIITTKKDYIKLKSRERKGIFFLEVEIVLKKEKELLSFIKNNI